MNAIVVCVEQQLVAPAGHGEGEAPPEPPRKEARREARPPVCEPSAGDAPPEPARQGEGEAPSEPVVRGAPAVVRTRILGGCP